MDSWVAWVSSAPTTCTVFPSMLRSKWSTRIQACLSSPLPVPQPPPLLQGTAPSTLPCLADGQRNRGSGIHEFAGIPRNGLGCFLWHDALTSTPHSLQVEPRFEVLPFR